LSEGSHDGLLVSPVADVAAGPAAELLPVVAASTDDVARADSPHSLSGDLTGYRIVLDTYVTMCMLHSFYFQTV